MIFRKFKVRSFKRLRALLADLVQDIPGTFYPAGRSETYGINWPGKLTISIYHTKKSISGPWEYSHSLIAFKGSMTIHNTELKTADEIIQYIKDVNEADKL